jgi:hypothetical protein
MAYLVVLLQIFLICLFHHFSFLLEFLQLPLDLSEILLVLECETLTGDFDFGVDVSCEFECVSCAFFVFYSEGGGDVRDGCGFAGVDVFIEEFADSEQGAGVVDL